MPYKIAVVIPVYNGESTIMNSINSLLKQTFTEWICIIVNDGSTDNTSKIIDRLDDPRFIQIKFKQNKGRPYARQAALDKIRELGVRYMCMLDADDWYYPDKLRFQYYYMEVNKEISLLSTGMGVTSTEGNLIRINSPFDSLQKLYFDKYENYVMIPHASSIIRVSDINGIDFDYSMKLGQDQNFLCRALYKKKYVFIPDIHYIYNRGASFSLSKYKKSSKYLKKSLLSLTISPFSKFKKCLLIDVKTIIICLLILVGFEELYLNRIGRLPNENEINKFIINCAKLQKRYL